MTRRARRRARDTAEALLPCPSIVALLRPIKSTARAFRRRRRLMEISMNFSSPLPCCLSAIQTRRVVGPRRIGLGFLDTPNKSRAFLGHRSVKPQIKSSSVWDMHRCKSSLESLFSNYRSIPHEIIDKPVGLSLSRREIGSNPPCNVCQAKGAVLCGTCSGSGLYVDSIMESQGIIVKVRCLGCGGSGNVMCSTCGGRGHTC